MTTPYLPNGYENLEQRTFQSWNSDSKQFIVNLNHIILVDDFINATVFTNGLANDPENTGIKLYRHLNGTYHLRGGVQYIGTPASGNILLLNDISSILEPLEIKNYKTSVQIALASDPLAAGAFLVVGIKWGASNVIYVEGGGGAPLTGPRDIFIDFIFYPNSF